MPINRLATVVSSVGIYTVLRRTSVLKAFFDGVLRPFSLICIRSSLFFWASSFVFRNLFSGSPSGFEFLGGLAVELAFGRNLWAGWASKDILRPEGATAGRVSLLLGLAVCTRFCSPSWWIAKELPVLVLRRGLTPVRSGALISVVNSMLAVSSQFSKLSSHSLLDELSPPLPRSNRENLDGHGVPTSPNRPDMVQLNSV